MRRENNNQRIVVAFAVGYLLKNAAVERLCEGICEAHAGGAPMPSEIAKRMLAYFHGQKRSDKRRADLSQRELEVLGALTQGLSDKVNADTLHISIPTVGFHLKNSHAKRHVNSRAQAVIKALQGKIFCMKNKADCRLQERGTIVKRARSVAAVTCGRKARASSTIAGKSVGLNVPLK